MSSGAEPYSYSAHGIAQAVSTGKLNVEQIGEFYCQRIRDQKAVTNSLTCFDEDNVRKQLEGIKARLGKEELPLAGVPIIIKDNIVDEDMPTTCCSRMLENFYAGYDATVVSKLKKAGALIIAKASCDEFAMGSTNEHSYFGPVKNPWDLTKVPGGSSGGSAAAVAHDLAPVSLGSETGGSIRQPASFCGLFGLKPTYGRISRYGLVAFASSLDHIGPFARNVKDLALIYDVIKGFDDKDSTSVLADKSEPDVVSLDSAKNLKGLKFGNITELQGSKLKPELQKIYLNACAQLLELGAEIVDISIPSIKNAVAAYYVLASAEAASNLSRYDGVRYGYRSSDCSTIDDLYRNSRSEGFGKEVKQRIMLGTFVQSMGYYSSFYGKAEKWRNHMRAEFRDVFQKVDFLISPTTLSTAFNLGEKNKDPLEAYLTDITTVSANLVGIPAMSMPIGFDDQSLPVGMQLMAAWQQEPKLLQVAYQYEQKNNWWQQRRPSI